MVNIIVGRFLDGESVEEIAKYYGFSTEEVEETIRRNVEQTRSKFSEFEEYES